MAYKKLIFTSGAIVFFGFVFASCGGAVSYEEADLTHEKAVEAQSIVESAIRTLDSVHSELDEDQADIVASAISSLERADTILGDIQTTFEPPPMPEDDGFSPDSTPADGGY
jgi:hypothetical protein